MPILSNWLDLPENTNPRAPVFEPPAQRVDMGSRLRVTPNNIFDDKTQKKIAALERFNAYQRNMREEQEVFQAQEQAKSALGHISSLDPRAPDYLDRRATVLEQFPLAARHPSVASVVGANDMVHSNVQRLKELQVRRQQEVMDAVTEDPSLAALYDNESRVSGEEGAMRKVAAELHNRKMTLSLIEAEHPGTPEALAPLMNEYGMIDTFKAGQYVTAHKRKQAQRSGLLKIAEITPRLEKARKEAAVLAEDPTKVDEDPEVKGYLDQINMIKGAYGLGDAPTQQQQPVAIKSIKLKTPAPTQ